MSESGGRINWIGDDQAELDGTRYVCRPIALGRIPSDADRLCICKTQADMRNLEALVERLSPRRIVEVGIFDGASTALLWQLARPSRLTAIEIAESMPGALAAFIAKHDRDGVISTHLGVDQSNRERLRQIVAADFGAEPLDLVIDDASHFLDETRASFEALFPLLRTGGEFLLEDWAWAHAPIEVWPNRAPLSLLVFEITIAAAHHPELVETLTVADGWTIVRRGPAAIAPEDFNLRALIGPRGRDIMDLCGNGNAIEPRRRSLRRRLRLDGRRR